LPTTMRASCAAMAARRCAVGTFWDAGRTLMGAGDRQDVDGNVQL
jgi:hypothetical protein